MMMRLCLRLFQFPRFEDDPLLITEQKNQQITVESVE